MNLQYLIKYQSFLSREEMDKTVAEHVAYHYEKLTPADREVLHCLSGHSVSAFGVSHLLTETIAKEVGISTRTVQRSTKKLTELGIITKHKTVKRTGQGASIYVIAPKINTRNVSHSKSEGCQSLETHVKPVMPTDSHVKNETVTKNLSTYSFNPSVNKNVNYVTAHGESDLKWQLRNIYQPSTVDGEQAFEELCKIAFGRLKQYMKSHQVPYTQMEQIVIKAMNDLVRKQGVRNQFAMYSKMIERQTLQLFDQHIKPKSTTYNFGKKVGVVPDWFEKGEHMEKKEKTLSESEKQYFEEQRKKLLAELGA